VNINNGNKHIPLYLDCVKEKIVFSLPGADRLTAAFAVADIKLPSYLNAIQIKFMYRCNKFVQRILICVFNTVAAYCPDRGRVISFTSVQHLLVHPGNLCTYPGVNTFIAPFAITTTG
jgi:hypothetical protein